MIRGVNAHCILGMCISSRARGVFQQAGHEIQISPSIDHRCAGIISGDSPEMDSPRISGGVSPLYAAAFRSRLSQGAVSGISRDIHSIGTLSPINVFHK